MWSVVEQGMGQLKRRFRVLDSEVRLTPPVKVCNMIQVCGMLHNLCKDKNIPIPFVGADAEGALNTRQSQEVQLVTAGDRNQGHTYRDEFCNLHFK